MEEHVYIKTKLEKDAIKTLILQKFEEITNKSNNTITHMLVLRLLDIILKNKWYAVEQKDVWNLIYLANYLFDLHDIFKGSFIAERAVVFSKDILMSILGRKNGKLNNDQSQEITKMLSNDVIKNFEQVTLEFDIESKKIRQKLENFEMNTKVEGMQELIALF
jgi:predicted nucleic-acid-binding protein